MLDIKPWILLIDDDEDDLEMLKVLLEEHEVGTLTFESGYRAVSYFEDIKDPIDIPSMIIIDYSMPIMNGLETLIRIKKMELVCHIPVLIYSTTINQLLERSARDYGAYRCVSKALNLTDLKKKAAYFAELAHSFSEQNKNSSYGQAFG